MTTLITDLYNYILYTDISTAFAIPIIIVSDIAIAATYIAIFA